ncbi:MAG TPA: AMP-binding protein [Pyrinomonadaceae bacterium]|nr:AMP-binding protein [Pyrinomonadaceae bacterium]
MIFTSPHPPISIPDIPITDYVLRHAARLGNKAALVDGVTGRTYSYQELPERIRQVAAGFAAHGLKKGDVLAIYSPNVPEYAIAFHAAATIGVATTMVPPLFTEEETSKQLRDSGAKYILTVAPLLQKARAADESNKIVTFFVIGDAEGAVSFDSLSTHGMDLPQIQIDPARDVVALPYSSGTTGFPKGVMLTHRNLVAMLCQMEVTEPFSEPDTLVCVVPMSHLYGLHIVVNLGFSQGATIVTVPRYDLEQFLNVLEQYRVTVAPLVPPLVLALSRAPQVLKHDLSALRVIHCGAAPLADEIASACRQRLGVEIRYGYGMTEVSPLSHASLVEPGKHKPGSVGFCLPNTECRIVDYTTGEDLPPRSEGEIWVRGPQVMKGYLGNTAATEQMIEPDGWLRTGDIGYCDEDGQLFVVDRLKELIKTNGRQVAPAELESLLISYPAIADAAVVARADEVAGEVPRAFVVLKDDATEDEIIQYVAERVAPYKRIREVSFVAEIPRNAAGKILRRVLKER